MLSKLNKPAWSFEKAKEIRPNSILRADRRHEFLAPDCEKEIADSWESWFRRHEVPHRRLGNMIYTHRWDAGLQRWCCD